MSILTSFEEGGPVPAAAVDEDEGEFIDHKHLRVAELSFNDLGPQGFSTQQLPTLIVDDQPVQQPIEGDPSAIACPRQHLRLSNVLQLKHYCVDSCSRRCVPYRLDAIRKAKMAAFTSNLASQAAQQAASSKGLGLSIAAISRKGFAPGYKEDNQDRCMVVQPFVNANQVLIGVMDGHGVEGHRVSEFIKSCLPGVLRGHLLMSGQTPRKAYVGAFHEVDSLMSISSGIDAENSGSTAVMGLLQDKKLTTAWVGDSRGVVGYFRLGGQGGKPAGWKAKDLSVDHKPENESERRRILMCKGRVERTRNRQGQCMGCHRVWLPHANYPGLAMSRAIGDTVVRAFGVTCTPEITTHKLGSRDCFLVFASDGVWEHLSSQEVVELVGKQVGYEPEPVQAPKGRAAWHLKWQEQQEKRKEEQRQKEEQKQQLQREKGEQKAQQQRQKQEQKVQQQQRQAQEKAKREEERRLEQEQQKQQARLQDRAQHEKKKHEQKQQEQQQKVQKQQEEKRKQEEQKKLQKKQKQEQKEREQQQKVLKQQEEKRKQEEQRKLQEKQRLEQKQREQQQQQQKQQEEKRKQEEQRKLREKQKQEQKQREEQQRQQEQQRKQEEKKKQQEKQQQRQQRQQQLKAEQQQQQQQRQQQAEEQNRAWQLRLQQLTDPEQRKQQQQRQQQEKQVQKLKQQEEERQRQQRQQEEQRRKQEEQKQRQKQQQEEQRRKQKQLQEEQKQKQKQQREQQEEQKRKEKQLEKKKKGEEEEQRKPWKFWGRKSEDGPLSCSEATQVGAKHHWGKLMGKVHNLKVGKEGGELAPEAAQQQGTVTAEAHDAAAMRACAALVSEARSRWVSEYNGQYIDDISAVVVLLHDQTNHQHELAAHAAS